jgi:hypothetical protein
VVPDGKQQSAWKISISEFPQYSTHSEALVQTDLDDKWVIFLCDSFSAFKIDMKP